MKQARPSISKQANRFPHHGQNRQPQTAKKRHYRTVETLQANINGPSKHYEPQHKENASQQSALGDLFPVHFGIDQPD